MGDLPLPLGVVPEELLQPWVIGAGDALVNLFDRGDPLVVLCVLNVDLAGGFISVTKALTKRSGMIKVEDTKTDYGRRRIEMSGSLVHLLGEHRRAEQARGGERERCWAGP